MVLGFSGPNDILYRVRKFRNACGSLADGCEPWGNEPAFRVPHAAKARMRGFGWYGLFVAVMGWAFSAARSRQDMAAGASVARMAPRTGVWKQASVSRSEAGSRAVLAIFQPQMCGNVSGGGSPVFQAARRQRSGNGDFLNEWIRSAGMRSARVWGLAVWKPLPRL